MKRNIDFLIVGGMKCGTSSLRNYLSQLDECNVLPAEGNFFNLEAEYNSGIKNYIDRFKKQNPNAELRLGEKTVEYSLFPEVPARINKHFPNIRLIWILRDPVQRTYSNYLHEYKRGIEHLSFDAAIQRELNKEVDLLYAYLGKSRYSQQIERFLEHFSKEQILFLSFERLRQSPKEVLEEVHKFIHIKESPSVKKYNSILKNHTYLPRFPALNRWAYKNLPARSFIKLAINLINFYKVKPGYPPLSVAQRTNLEARLESEKQWMDDFFPAISANWQWGRLARNSIVKN